MGSGAKPSKMRSVSSSRAMDKATKRLNGTNFKSHGEGYNASKWSLCLNGAFVLNGEGYQAS